MHTVRINQIGAPLVSRTVEDLVPGPGEVLVRIMAAGICHSDVHYRDGVAPVKQLPVTPGHEIAGIVVDQGSAIRHPQPATRNLRVSVGDRVCVHYLVTCGRCEYCITGREQWCPTAEMIGKDRDGGYAEYIVVPERNAILIPDGVSDAHAAVMMCSSATALHAIRKARMSVGESVAVFGCGGLGTSAIQIAKIMGAREIFGVDLNPDKLELASRLGATPIDAAKSDASDIILSITHGRGVDVALELIGTPNTMQQALRSVGVGGRVAIAGVTDKAVEIRPYMELINKEAEVIGVSDHHVDEIEQLLDWADDGRFDLTEVVTERVDLDAEKVNDVLDSLARGAAAARTVILPLVIMAAAILLGQSECLIAQEADSTEILPVKISHGSKGFEFETGDGKYLLQIDSRMQFRYAFPSDTDPITGEDFIDDDRHELKVNRARLKVGGHAFKPWFKYYWEYDFVGSNLLDFRVMIERFEWLKLKVGQWKVHYSRERIISSGKQQLADRSIINRVFTLDRQQGVSLSGRIRAGGPADFSYWASVLMGTGRGAGENDDDNLMWMGRAQWNPLGRVVKFEGSDTGPKRYPALLFAVAAVTNQSQYVTFSTGGGKPPPGEEGLPGQFRVNQVQFETAFMYRGFSWQHESHWKDVEDTIEGREGTVTGSYFQGGLFLNTLLSVIPPQLEIAGRYAFYDAGFLNDDDTRDEVTVGVNWFFSGHRNKLTTELSFFDLVDAETGEVAEELRFRVQWDVSF